MYYLFYEPMQYYFHKKGKIILFNDPRIAAEFLNGFINYSFARMTQEGGNVMEVMSLPNNVKINLADEKFFQGITCETINFSELQK